MTLYCFPCEDLLSTLHLFQTCSLSCVTPIDELFNSLLLACFGHVVDCEGSVHLQCPDVFLPHGGSFLLKLAPLPHPFRARQLVWISLMISLMQADSQDCSLSCPSASFSPMVSLVSLD